MKDANDVNEVRQPMEGMPVRSGVVDTRISERRSSGGKSIIVNPMVGGERARSSLIAPDKVNDDSDVGDSNL